eukprot:11983469-Prorocentrum_lima.AAC.1
MTSSLVGSEMCIRDRTRGRGRQGPKGRRTEGKKGNPATASADCEDYGQACLLYTSDAADDM